MDGRPPSTGTRMQTRHVAFSLVALLAVLLLALGLVLSQASLSALDEPGRLETYAATRAKRFVVARRAREASSKPRPVLPNPVAIGGMQFRGRCASCHGLDGRTASEIGRWMYPRASDLGSAPVQEWLDAELFWIIKNGIRLTGMPGFGKVLSDEEIWPLVDYIRTLAPPKDAQSTSQPPEATDARERRWRPR